MTRAFRSGDPLRVCMLVPYDLCDRGGGVKHHALHLAHALRQQGDEVTIFGPSTDPVNEPHMHGLPGILSFQGNGSDNRIGALIRPWQVRNFFRANPFDVLHVHEPLLPMLPAWSAWLSGKLPKICTFHAYSEAPPRAMVAAQRAWSKLSLPRFTRGIAVSEAAARSARIAWQRPLTILPNGVQTERFTPTSPRSTSDTLRLLFIGRIGDARKGVKHLLEGFAMARSRGVDATLDLVGEAGGGTVPDQPGVTYHGPVGLRTLVERLHASDVLVACSTGQESFGIVLLEAMAAGCAILCSDIDGYRTVVDDAAALLVPPADPLALADGITKLAKEPALWKRMAAENANRVRAYDWNALAPRVREEYLLTMAQASEPRAS